VTLMSTFANDRGRPATNGTPSKMSITNDVPIVTPLDGQIRCTRCGHLLHADESVRLAIGPVCRRLVSDLAEVAA